jgi:hypothetical protein
MITRTEEDIRKRIAELEVQEQNFNRSIYTHRSDGTITREDYSKSVLRAQIKGLLWTLNESNGYLISGEKKVGEP